MNLASFVDPPMLTAELPGLGGIIRERPEDFVVDEIPAYEPSGAGEHLYLWLEKRDTGAEWLLKHVAQRLQMPRGEIGCAGLKDRHAITRQYLSVPAKLEERVPSIDDENVRVLHTKRHGNKLRTGHQKGNRFTIRVRGIPVEQKPLLDPIIERLKQVGLPNYYGEQRFGRANETLETGFKLLRGERLRVPPFLKKLSLSSVQSVLFNAFLARRLSDGLLSRVLLGDVMRLRTGGLFVAEDLAAEQPRFDRRETVPAGPIFGKKTYEAKAEAAERETQFLAEAGFTADSFAGFGNLLEGTRRENLVFLEDLQADWDDEGLVLRFSLPSGSYATVLLREIMKTKAEQTVEENMEEPIS
jgi:tRNA pseudouridine13 synthase